MERSARCSAVFSALLMVFGSRMSLAAAQSDPSIVINSSGIHIYSQELVNTYLEGSSFLQSAQKNGLSTDPQMLMALELARASKRNLDEILAYRTRSLSWYDIMRELNVDPSIFYPAVDVSSYGTPYAPAYDCFRNGSCANTRWSDEDLVHLAAVKLISEYTQQPVPNVIQAFQSHPRISFYKNRAQAPVVAPAIRLGSNFSAAQALSNALRTQARSIPPGIAKKLRSAGQMQAHGKAKGHPSHAQSKGKAKHAKKSKKH